MLEVGVDGAIERRSSFALDESKGKRDRREGVLDDAVAPVIEAKGRRIHRIAQDVPRVQVVVVETRWPGTAPQLDDPSLNLGPSAFQFFQPASANGRGSAGRFECVVEALEENRRAEVRDPE